MFRTRPNPLVRRYCWEMYTQRLMQITRVDDFLPCRPASHRWRHAILLSSRNPQTSLATVHCIPPYAQGGPFRGRTGHDLTRSTLRAVLTRPSRQIIPVLESEVASFAVSRWKTPIHSSAGIPSLERKLSTSIGSSHAESWG